MSRASVLGVAWHAWVDAEELRTCLTKVALDIHPPSARISAAKPDKAREKSAVRMVPVMLPRIYRRGDGPEHYACYRHAHKVS